MWYSLKTVKRPSALTNYGKLHTDNPHIILWGIFHAVLFSAQNSSTVNDVQDVVLETHYGVYT